MIIVNDIIPIVSGEASLGVDSNPFLFNEIVPFGNIHIFSGIFHDPIYGTSGIIRFNPSCAVFEASIDGGIIFNTIALADTTLQRAYQAGGFVDINDSPLITVTDDEIFRPSTGSTLAPINISGMTNSPANNNSQGNIFMLKHGITSGVIHEDLANESTIKARALGVGQLVLNTGSGLADLSIGSGYMMYQMDPDIVLSLDPATTPTSGILIPFTNIITPDANYGSGIRHTEDDQHTAFTVFSPGLYECSYGVAFNRDAGSNRLIPKVQMRRNFHVVLPASASYAYLRDSSSTDRGSCAATFLFEANAGDTFSLNALIDTGATGNTGIINQVFTTIVVRKVSGARRHEAEQVDF